MTSSKEELKKQYLIKRLEDPEVDEWEKKKIRNKLGIFSRLTEQDFDKPKDNNFTTFFHNYIEQNIGRLNKKNKTNNSFEVFPENIKSIYNLWSFSATFESDCFWDYSEISLKKYEQENDYSLREDKNGLLKGMQNIGLTEDSEFLEAYWNKTDITENDIEEIQAKFWGSDYKKDFLNRVINLIIKSKTELIELQDL